MKRWLAAILLLCAGAGICYYLWFRDKGQKVSTETTATPPVVVTSNAAPLVPSERAATPPTNTVANAPVVAAPPPVANTVPGTTPPNWPRSGPLGLAPDIVLRNARAAVTQYGSMFHGNPVGTNPEITSALNGNNPKQVKFINAESGLQINDKGELVDPWGTPFFFHQLSARDMEVRSAGPDKVMWSADDLVTR